MLYPINRKPTIPTHPTAFETAAKEQHKAHAWPTRKGYSPYQGELCLHTNFRTSPKHPNIALNGLLINKGNLENYTAENFEDMIRIDSFR
jgi:hypothetical protein